MGKVERGDPPSLTPVGWSGGDGMPTATMVDDWIVSLGSWASGWSEDLGSCIGNMASVAWYTDVGDLQARVSDREDTLLRSDIVPLLSHKVRKSIGESKVRGGSGLAILHALVLLYKGGKVEGRARVLRGVSHPEECTNLVQLHAALKVWEASIEEASLMSQTYTDEQLQLYCEVMYTGIPGVEEKVNNKVDTLTELKGEGSVKYTDVVRWLRVMCDKAKTKSLNSNPNPKPIKPKPKPTPTPTTVPEVPKPPAITMVANKVGSNECWDYLMGKCKYGSECKFVHTPGLESTGKGGAIERQLKAMSLKPCNEFRANGTCKFGESCRFSHATTSGDAEEVREAPQGPVRRVQVSQVPEE